MRLTSAAAWTTFALLFTAGCGNDGNEDPESEESTYLTVTITNVSDQADVPTSIAPGLWVTHTEGEPIFTVGERDRGEGLETLAEEGSPDDLEKTLSELYSAEPFDATLDDYVEAAEPGESLIFEVEVRPGDRLSFAAMVVQSNDYFVGTPPSGVSLFDADGKPRLGSFEVKIWDAGTEVDQPLGEGSDQPKRQAAPNTGAAEDAAIEESELDASEFVTVSVSQGAPNDGE